MMFGLYACLAHPENSHDGCTTDLRLNLFGTCLLCIRVTKYTVGVSVPGKAITIPLEKTDDPFIRRADFDKLIVDTV